MESGLAQSFPNYSVTQRCQHPVRFKIVPNDDICGEFELVTVFINSATALGWQKVGVNDTRVDLTIPCENSYRHGNSAVMLFPDFPKPLIICNKIGMATYFGQVPSVVYPPTYILRPNASKELDSLGRFTAKVDEALGVQHSAWLIKPSHLGTITFNTSKIEIGTGGQGIILVNGSDLKKLPQLSIQAARYYRQPVLVQHVAPNLDRFRFQGQDRHYSVRTSVAFVVTSRKQPVVMWSPEAASALLLSEGSRHTGNGYGGANIGKLMTESAEALLTNYHVTKDENLARPITELITHFNSSGRLHAWRRAIKLISKELGKVLSTDRNLPVHPTHGQAWVGVLGCDIIFTTEVHPLLIECNPQPGAWYEPEYPVIGSMWRRAFSALMLAAQPGCLPAGETLNTRHLQGWEQIHLGRVPIEEVRST